MSFAERVRDELARLEAEALLRVPRTALPPGTLDFSSNDYLGLRRDARVLAALRGSDAAGSGGSRLLAGVQPEFAALESELAAWTGRERALLFSSGYLAALGAIATFARFFEVAYSDELVHACAIDALRLAKIPRRIVPHATVPVRAGGEGAALVVTDSLFGMDGSVAPLDAHAAALRAPDALVIDEAHALGVAGCGGAGLAAHLRDERVIIIGTLSKALGAAGGFVAGPAPAIALLATAARTFIFDTAPPPGIAAAARAALAVVRSAEGDRLRARLTHNVRRLRAGLRAGGFAVPEAPFAVVPLIVGGERDALALALDLERQGIFCPAIRPPTVPPGSSRLRVSVRADHSAADIEALADAVTRARFAGR